MQPIHRHGRWSLQFTAMATWACFVGALGCSGASTAPGGPQTGSGGSSATSTGGAANPGTDAAVPGSGGAVGSGGTTATGGTMATGGTIMTGGAGSVGSGGNPGSGGQGGGPVSPVDAGNRDGGLGSDTMTTSDGPARDAGTTPTPDATSAGDTGGADPTQKITLWLAGDSTMADPSGTCPVGWGNKFQPRFSANAKVVNNAVGGTTVRSWLYDVTSTLGSDGECKLGSTAFQSHWTQIANGMKAGDYLFIQFGINDTTSSSCPKHVSYDTFKQLFGMMATAATGKGAHPIFLTPVSSISCMGSAAQGTRGGYANATKEAGTQYGVPVIDLEQLSVALYTSLGFCPSTDTAATFSASTPIGKFFCNDHTHFEADGATQIAALVAKAIKDQGFPLAAYLAM